MESLYINNNCWSNSNQNSLETGNENILESTGEVLNKTKNLIQNGDLKKESSLRDNKD